MDWARRAALQLIQGQTATIDDLWLTFLSVGGDAGQLELEAYIFGMIPISATDEELLAAAVNELQHG